MAKILIIGEEKIQLEFERRILKNVHHEIDIKDDIDYIEEKDLQGYDLILFNAMKVEKKEYQACKRVVNKSNCPVLLLVKDISEDEKVEGFNIGVYDVITKYCGVKEFVARINSHLRISERNRISDKNKEDKISDKGISFDFNLREVYIDGERLSLTNYEYKICEILAKNKYKTFTKENIYDLLYDIDTDAQFRTITEFIYSIRKKFGLFKIKPIKTIWGVGYRWEIERDIKNKTRDLTK